MTAAATTLPIDQRIIELESKISEARFLKRFTLLWLIIGNPLIASAVVAGNLFIDWSAPGGGQAGLNVAGTLAFLVSTGASIYWWYNLRTLVRVGEMEIRQREAEKRALQVTEAGTRPLTSAFHTYYESVPSIRDEYRRSAERYRSRHNVFQLTVIVGSILTSVSTTASSVEQGIWSWIAVGLSALVSISAGIIAYFKFRERSLNLQQTADSIDLEVQAYALGIRRYKHLPLEEASALFAEEVERIREEQRKKELQLEQPPEASQQRAQPA
ncbi:DUF4231 domain-containing protein [Streptomyces sp. NPDC088337]|uniref:DUF4231 domain-containing protein n=1 Tax=unclassified Streptomyces TaxID=2593676 RepID=UPI003807DDF7